MPRRCLPGLPWAWTVVNRGTAHVASGTCGISIIVTKRVMTRKRKVTLRLVFGGPPFAVGLFGLYLAIRYAIAHGANEVSADSIYAMRASAWWIPLLVYGFAELFTRVSIAQYIENIGA